MKKYKSSDEWLRQAEYDMDTARAMLESGRYIYTVFMAHLSLEKAIKAVYANVFEDNPPKIHHLLYLIDKIQSKAAFEVPESILTFLGELDKVSVPVRYPEDLQSMSKNYTKDITAQLLHDAQESLQWLKNYSIQ